MDWFGPESAHLREQMYQECSFMSRNYSQLPCKFSDDLLVPRRTRLGFCYTFQPQVRSNKISKSQMQMRKRKWMTSQTTSSIFEELSCQFHDSNPGHCSNVKCQIVWVFSNCLWFMHDCLTNIVDSLLVVFYCFMIICDYCLIDNNGLWFPKEYVEKYGTLVSLRAGSGGGLSFRVNLQQEEYAVGVASAGIRVRKTMQSRIIVSFNLFWAWQNRKPYLVHMESCISFATVRIDTIIMLHFLNRFQGF